MKTTTITNQQQELFSVVLFNMFKKAEELLSQDIDVNFTEDYGYTPLHIAVENENIDMAKLLINKGADVNAKDGRGDTPLHIAVKNENHEFITLLIVSKASLNVKNNKGETPLFYSLYL